MGWTYTRESSTLKSKSIAMKNIYWPIAANISLILPEKIVTEYKQQNYQKTQLSFSKQSDFYSWKKLQSPNKSHSTLKQKVLVIFNCNVCQWTIPDDQSSTNSSETNQEKEQKSRTKTVKARTVL